MLCMHSVLKNTLELNVYVSADDTEHPGANAAGAGPNTADYVHRNGWTCSQSEPTTHVCSSSRHVPSSVHYHAAVFSRFDDSAARPTSQSQSRCCTNQRNTSRAVDAMWCHHAAIWGKLCCSNIDSFAVFACSAVANKKVTDGVGSARGHSGLRARTLSPCCTTQHLSWSCWTKTHSSCWTQ